MKRINMGLLHYVLLLAVVLFITVSLSSCNQSGNVTLNDKDLIIVKLKELYVPKGICLKSDTSKVDKVQIDSNRNSEITGDFRYDYMFK